MKKTRQNWNLELPFRFDRNGKNSGDLAAAAIAAVAEWFVDDL